MAPYFLFLRRKQVANVEELIVSEEELHEEVEEFDVVDEVLDEVDKKEEVEESTAMVVKDDSLDEIFVLRGEPDKKKRKSSTFIVAMQ